MPAVHTLARRALALLAGALAGLLLLVPVSAGAAGSQGDRHRAHGKRAHRCATVRHARARHGRRRAARRRCARAAGLPQTTLVAPVPGTTVQTSAYLRGRATVSGMTVNHVTFRIDGKAIKKDYHAPFSFRSRASRIGAGRHLVQAVGLRGGVQYPSRSVPVDVVGSTPPPPATDPSDPSDRSDPSDPSDATWTQGKTWASSFETGDFTEWSWWGQDQQYLWGHIATVDPTAEGIPPLGGTHVARFETTPDDIANGREHAKLYKFFGTDIDQPGSRPPSDVSGVYSSWYYLPENYSVPGDSWVNIFQFKEQYRTPAGGHSDPLWWVQLGGAAWASSMSQAYGEGAIGGRPDAPVAFIDYWYNNWRETRKFVPVPLGRWFELKAVLRQNDRIDFFIDGKPLDTAKASTYPVSPFHGDQSMEWIFGVGNYSTAANGPLYADRVSYTGF